MLSVLLLFFSVPQCLNVLLTPCLFYCVFLIFCSFLVKSMHVSVCLFTYSLIFIMLEGFFLHLSALLLLLLLVKFFFLSL